MATLTAAPSTYKQPSRKGKKAWRKNVDVTEISKGLDDVRDELIHGGVISEKASDELFVLDTTGSAEIKRKHLPDAKPLKADQVIAERASAISALDGRKRKADGDDKGSSKRRKNTYVGHEEVQRLKMLAAGTSGNTEVEASGANFDPWTVEVKVQDPRFSYLEEKQPKREPTTLKHKPNSLAASGKAYAAVKRPGAEKSYNPDFEAWQVAVDKAGAREVVAERKRLHAAAEEEEREAKALAEAARPERVDGAESDYESAWESEWEGIKSGAEEDANANKKRPERKTPAERNKIKRRKEAEQLARHEKNMSLRSDQQQRIKEIAKEVRRAEAERREKQHQLAVLGDSSEESDGGEEVLRRRRYGKNALPEAPLELVLADELQDSLRALKPEGNLLKDRFRNLLVNGKVEARKAITQPKKPKRTRTEKWSYKDWKLRP